MRPRRRYVVLEAHGGAGNSGLGRELISPCRAAGIDTTQLKIIFYDNGLRRCLLRCGHSQVDAIKAAMTGSGCNFRVVGVSGTIRAARRKFFRQAQKG